ncbi:Abhd17a [Symbiodinium microadriaticum]|nr:Abhd17a [Symbiodinium microadriaticum]CAE7919282.1 Abhd17a [Symbiodinium sp. KB8]
MGGAINTLAFPAPNLPRQFYEDELKTRPDLVWLETVNKERIPACHVRGGSSGKTLLYSHGNAEDLGLHLEYIDSLAHFTGADVFSYEYVGYSLSKLQGCQPSEAACLRSIDAAWRYLVDMQKIPPQQIIIFGRSIGSGPSVDLASRKEVEGSQHSPLNAAGVVLQSPLESGARAVLGHVTSFLGYHLDIFRNYEKIDKITSPVAIMHGTRDEVVPYANGEALYKKLLNPFPPLWIDGHGHNDMPQARCFNYVKEFVRHLNKGRT